MRCGVVRAGQVSTLMPSLSSYSGYPVKSDPGSWCQVSTPALSLPLLPLLCSLLLIRRDSFLHSLRLCNAEGNPIFSMLGQ